MWYVYIRALIGLIVAFTVGVATRFVLAAGIIVGTNVVTGL